MEGLKKLKFKRVPTFKGGRRGDLKIYFLGWRELNLGGDLEVHVEAGTINDTTSVEKKNII